MKKIRSEARPSLSQGKLALMMGGVDPGTISRWERGITEPSDAHLAAWARVMNIEYAVAYLHIRDGSAMSIEAQNLVEPKPETAHDIRLALDLFADMPDPTWRTVTEGMAIEKLSKLLKRIEFAMTIEPDMKLAAKKAQ